jgi:hypothetical protein
MQPREGVLPDPAAMPCAMNENESLVLSAKHREPLPKLMNAVIVLLPPYVTAPFQESCNRNTGSTAAQENIRNCGVGSVVAGKG